MKALVEVLRTCHMGAHAQTLFLKKKLADLTEQVQEKSLRLGTMKRTVQGASYVLYDIGLDCLLGDLFDFRDIKNELVRTTNAPTAFSVGGAFVPDADATGAAPRRRVIMHKYEDPPRGLQTQGINRGQFDNGQTRLGNLKRQRPVRQELFPIPEEREIDSPVEIKRTKVEDDRNPAFTTSAQRAGPTEGAMDNATKLRRLVTLGEHLTRESNRFLAKSLTNISAFQKRLSAIETDLSIWEKEARRLMDLLVVHNVQHLIFMPRTHGVRRTPIANWLTDAASVARITNPLQFFAPQASFHNYRVVPQHAGGAHLGGMYPQMQMHQLAQNGPTSTSVASAQQAWYPPVSQVQTHHTELSAASCGWGMAFGGRS